MCHEPLIPNKSSVIKATKREDCGNLARNLLSFCLALFNCSKSKVVITDSIANLAKWLSGGFGHWVIGVNTEREFPSVDNCKALDSTMLTKLIHFRRRKRQIPSKLLINWIQLLKSNCTDRYIWGLHVDFRSQIVNISSNNSVARIFKIGNWFSMSSSLTCDIFLQLLLHEVPFRQANVKGLLSTYIVSVVR